MAKVLLFFLTELFTTGTGKTMRGLEMVIINGRMAVNTEDRLLKARLQEEALIYSLMVINTLANSSKMKCMDMVSLNMQMAANTLATLRMETMKAVGVTFGQMGSNITEIGKMIRELVQAPTNGMTALNMKAHL